MPNPDNNPQLPKNQSAISTNGVVSRDWYRFFFNLLTKVNEGGGGGNGTGTVTSVAVSGGSTGLTTSGGPITTNGTITLSGTVNVANGGTGATTAANARTSLSVPSLTGTGASGTWGINVTGSAANVSGVVAIANGGTGATTAATARTNLSAAQSGANTDITSIALTTGTISTAPSASTDIVNKAYADSVGATYTNGTGLNLTSNTFSIADTGTAGTYGSASVVPVLTTNAQGQVTAVTNTTIAISGSAVSGNISGSAGNVTGVVAVLNGGTGETSYTDGQLLIGNSTGNTLTKSTLTAGTGISITNGGGSITINATNAGAVTSVTGTSPVVSSGGATPNISLASGYGDTQNPYASKTANYFLAAPNGTAGVPTFRAVVAADIPTLNQNTTGTAGNVTGVVAIANGGTGQTTAVAAFDALSPATTKGDLIVSNGTDNIRQAVGADTYVLTADSTTASGIKWAASSGSGATITNDTTTATNLYPTFAAATSGSLTTIYTSNANYLYKPSTGELTSPEVVASNGIFVNSQTVSANYTIPAGSTAISGGPITVASGIAVTVSSGARWVTV